MRISCRSRSSTRLRSKPRCFRTTIHTGPQILLRSRLQSLIADIELAHRFEDVVRCRDCLARVVVDALRRTVELVILKRPRGNAAASDDATANCVLKAMLCENSG